MRGFPFITKRFVIVIVPVKIQQCKLSYGIYWIYKSVFGMWSGWLFNMSVLRVLYIIRTIFPDVFCPKIMRNKPTMTDCNTLVLQIFGFIRPTWATNTDRREQHYQLTGLSSWFCVIAQAQIYRNRLYRRWKSRRVVIAADSGRFENRNTRKAGMLSGGRIFENQAGKRRFKIANHQRSATREYLLYQGSSTSRSGSTGWSF